MRKVYLNCKNFITGINRAVTPYGYGISFTFQCSLYSASL